MSDVSATYIRNISLDILRRKSSNGYCVSDYINYLTTLSIPESPKEGCEYVRGKDKISRNITG